MKSKIFYIIGKFDFHRTLNKNSPPGGGRRKPMMLRKGQYKNLLQIHHRQGHHPR